MQTHASTTPGLSVGNALQPLITLPAVDRTAQPLPKALSVYLDALQKADRRQQAAATEREEDEADEALAFTDEAATPVDAATLAALDAGPGEALMQLADAGKRTATDAGTRTQEDDDDNGGLLLWGPYAGAGLLGGALIGAALDKDDTPPAVTPLTATFTTAQQATEAGDTLQGQLTARGGSGLQYAQLGDEVPGLTINSDGSWSFDPTDVAYHGMAEGQERVITVAYTVRSDAGASDTETFTITVTGTRDTPVATFTAAQEATEDGAVITGQLTATDVDAGVALTYALDGEPIAGLTINGNGSWRFDPSHADYQALALDETLDITVSYTVADANGVADTEAFTITLTGTNDAPVATFTTAEEATEDGAVITGQLTATDADTGAVLTYALEGDAIAGFTLNSGGSWTLDPSHEAYQALATDETQEITVTYRVTDENGAIDTESFTITVAGVGSGGACAMDFSFPEAPNDPTALRLGVADLEQELQASGGSLAYTEDHTSLVVDVGYRGEVASEAGYDFGSGPVTGYMVNASGGMGDIHVTGETMASIQMQVNAGGAVGDVAFALGTETQGTGNALDIHADGNIGRVFMLASGVNAGGNMWLNASGGNVGDVTARFANPSGGPSTTYARAITVHASAQASGDALVGGNVGHLALAVTGTQSSGSVGMTADGGNTGDINLCISGFSASGTVYASALTQRNGAGEAVGGSVGDIVVHVTGNSGDGRVDAVAMGGNVGDIEVNVTGASGKGFAEVDADGIYSSEGNYLGGGNVGNIALNMTGGSGSAAANVEAYSGGSVGNITMTVADVGYSAYASATVQVYGGGGQVASIGDLNVDVLGGQGNGFIARLEGRSGGNVGNVYAHLLDQGGSGRARLYVSAFSNAEGGGGEIGEITLLNDSWGGDTDITLMAHSLMGNVSLATGGGSGRTQVRIQSDAGADVGDIHLTIDDDNYANAEDSYNYHEIHFELDSGASVGDFTVDGGSDRSLVQVFANRSPFEKYSAGVAADIDMTGYAGRAEIDLSRAVNGVSIAVGQGGSSVIGSKGEDTIQLGDGVDTVDFFYFDDDTVSKYADHPWQPEYGLRSVADTVNGFDVAQDRLDVLAGIDTVVFAPGEPWEWSEDIFTHQAPGEFHRLTSNTATTLADKDVVKLVDLAGGDDIMTAEGLLDALQSGGEYTWVDGVEGDFVFATATSADANSFNLYHVSHDGGAYTEVYLMAEVNFLNGSTFANLAIENFV